MRSSHPRLALACSTLEKQRRWCSTHLGHPPSSPPDCRQQSPRLIPLAQSPSSSPHPPTSLAPPHRSSRSSHPPAVILTIRAPPPTDILHHRPRLPRLHPSDPGLPCRSTDSIPAPLNLPHRSNSSRPSTRAHPRYPKHPDHSGTRSPISALVLGCHLGGLDLRHPPHAEDRLCCFPSYPLRHDCICHDLPSPGQAIHPLQVSTLRGP